MSLRASRPAKSEVKPAEHLAETKQSVEPKLGAKNNQNDAENDDKSILVLIVCVAGIYASFLTWAVLQERIATTPYGADQRIFRASHVINAVQNILACVVGYLFLSWKRRGSPRANQPLVPNRQVALQYLLVALCQALSSPFAYASLKYVDYMTLLLAKSCKLLPVMAVHLLLYRTKFPTYKYVVVSMITLGVSLFTIFQPSSGKAAASGELWGYVLLGINLFLDGLYNTTQDRMFARFKMVTGAHMMVVLNGLTALITVAALLSSRSQLSELNWFIGHHPQVLRDVALFGLCGAVGQVFIFLTLEHFGSLVLVTTTVTRKMMSMLLSVVMFNHKLGPLQWLGVLLVFAGIVAEAGYKRLAR